MREPVDLLDHLLHYFNHLHWNVNYFLNFDHFWYLHNLFHHLLNWHNLRYFNNSLDDFFQAKSIFVARAKIAGANLPHDIGAVRMVRGKSAFAGIVPAVSVFRTDIESRHSAVTERTE